MAFHEKSAWIMATGLLFGAFVYAGAVRALSVDLGTLAPPTLAPLIGFAVLLVLIAVVGHIAIAVMNPSEAESSLDERETRVVQRAGYWSSYVLATGIVLSLGSYLIVVNGEWLFYGVFGSLVLASFADYALQVVFFRTAL